jgi:hypothetical protein
MKKILRGTILPALILIMNTSLLAQGSPFNASIELIRGYALTADEQPIENTILVETEIFSIKLAIENIYYGEASTPSAATDEVNLYAGIGFGEYVSGSLLQRFVFEDIGNIETQLSGGAIVSLTLETAINITNDNEFTITYKDPSWEYLNTLLLEYCLFESGLLSTGFGVENEVILAKSSDASNGTLLFTSLGYKTLGITVGYIIETLPTVAHSIELGVTLEL